MQQGRQRARCVGGAVRIRYARLDGTCKLEDRQSSIDLFQKEGSEQSENGSIHLGGNELIGVRVYFL